MRVSEESLTLCEPLFIGFLNQSEIETTFRLDLFSAVHVDRDLFSETLRVLSSYAADRCLGVYCLLRNGLVWDAEIVLRSFYETVAKSLFLSSAPKAARESLLNEFWEILPAVYDAKGARKAEIVEKLARRFGESGDVHVFSGLRDPESFTVEPIGNKKYRNELEQRWSFSNIISVLNNGAGGHSRIAHAEAMSHNYGMASHLAHASPVAFDLMQDRMLRGDDLGPLERGHIARMLSDMVMLTAFMLHEIQVSLLGDMPMAYALSSAFQDMAEVSQPFQEAFQRSQDNFYGRATKE